MSNTDPTKQNGVNSGVDASYKTPVVLLMYTVKAGKGIYWLSNSIHYLYKLHVVVLFPPINSWNSICWILYVFISQ